MKYEPHHIRRLGLSLVGALSMTAGVHLNAQSNIDFADTPLFIGNTVDPNLLFIIDDSGSMAWSHIPDAIVGVCNSSSSQDNRARGRSYDYNLMYFNPDKPGGYLPPVDLINGTNPNDRLPNADFNDAWIDGYFASTSNRVNLETSFRATWRWPWRSNTHSEAYCGAAGAPDYYRFEPATADNQARGCNGSKEDNRCYTRYEIDLSDDAMKQSFANWYSYYRSRILASRGGIGEAFSKVPQNFRLGWGRLNKGAGSVDDVNSIRAVESGVRPLTDTRRQEFYRWLYAAPANGGTPLRRALEGAGEYYRLSDQAWADDPSQAYSLGSNDMYSCRQSFTILMTDGYYNGGAPNSKFIDADDTNGSTITNQLGASYRYTPSAPFTDGVSGVKDVGGLSGASLAEIAMYYWKNDLKPNVTGVDNLVPTLEKDLNNPTHADRVANPAFWQHMVTYGVGLGVSGSIDPDDAFNAIDTGATIDWWGGASSDERKVDDLLHAAVNSRGGFFSADDAETFGNELAGVINDIAGRTSSASSVDFETTRAQVGSLVFSAQFDTNNWSGDLKAAELIQEDPPIVPDFNTGFQDVINNNQGWSAAQLLNARNLSSDPRTILTYNEDTQQGAEFRIQGGAFDWGQLSAAQQADLQSGGADLDLAKLRGKYIVGDRSMTSDPATRDDFHTRQFRLGSIINSSPRYVARPTSRWPDMGHIGDGNYSAFVGSAGSRVPAVYVGSNNGKLHAFRATDALNNGGEELFAYVPGFLASTDADHGLHYLTRPGTSHRYYVDLEVHVQDVFSKGRSATGAPTASASWRTLLIGGARTGAKGLFALDITNPESMSSEQSVLWEFTANDDPRLGYITQPPAVALATWGGSTRWTVFLPNGYNSSTGSTGFFMLDVEGGLENGWSEGSDYIYIEFEDASATPTGLSPLIELDLTGDLVVNRVYAGDLKGNIWVAAGAGGAWAPTYSDPLFTADRPIVAMPNVVANYEVNSVTGNAPNLMVYFGTGRYFELNDVTSTHQDYVFGVWDKGDTGLDIDDLASRTFTTTTQTDKDGNTWPIRMSTGDDIDFTSEYGWVIPLPESGERVVTSSMTRFVDEDDSKGVIYMSSIVPDAEPCLGGGRSWILALGFDGRTPEVESFLNFDDPLAGFLIDGVLTTDLKFWDDWMVLPPLDGSTITPVPVPEEVQSGVGRRGWQEVM